MTPDLLRIEQLHFAWPNGRTLFSNADFSLGTGLNWLIGDEGSGKTTLLALTAGRLDARAGRFRVAGCSMHEAPERYRAQVFHAPAPSAALDAQTAAAYLETMADAWPHLDGAWLDELIAGLALSDHLGKQIHMLSTGTRRKLWTATALACGAPLALIDQPFAALDLPSVGLLTEVLQGVRHHTERAWWVADYAPAPTLADAPTVHLPD